MSGISLADELVLLAYDDDGVARGATNLDLGLGGAVLLDLALAGRIEVAGKRVTVRDERPTGDGLLDAALTRIRQDTRPRPAKDWVGRLARGTRRQVLDRLVARGVLRRDEDRVLWVLPRTRYPAALGGTPVAEVDARRRMRAAVCGEGTVDSRTAALCGLVSAMGWERRLFADVPRRMVKNRLTAIRRQEWAAEAVKAAIDEIQAAVATTVVVLAATSATAG